MDQKDDMQGWYIKSQCEIIRDKVAAIHNAISVHNFSAVDRIAEEIADITIKIEEDARRGNN